MSAGNDFIERSMVGALSFLKESVFAEEYALKNGFLQSLDARVKTVTVFLFLIAALMSRSFLFLAGLYGLCLALACVSRIGLGYFLKRTWVFIPLFSLLIALPALFQFISPGEPLFEIPFFFGARAVITRQGLFSASLFVSRVLTCVSFVVLLSLSTRHTQLLRVLRIFHIPEVFVMTMGMCYRYIYLFVGIVENIYKAMNSRVGARLHYRKGQEIVTWSMASLWQRSYQLNNEVYSAMLSRGYRGEPLVLDEFKAGARDWLWFFTALLIFGASLYSNYA